MCSAKIRVTYVSSFDYLREHLLAKVVLMDMLETFGWSLRKIQKHRFHLSWAITKGFEKFKQKMNNSPFQSQFLLVQVFKWNGKIREGTFNFKTIFLFLSIYFILFFYPLGLKLKIGLWYLVRPQSVANTNHNLYCDSGK